MQNLLYWSQIVIAILLIVVILLQQKSVGLGSEIAGGGAGGQSTKRGVDRLLGTLTGILAALFCGNALAYLFVI